VSGLDWQADGLCSQVGGDGWFPDKGGATRDAKAVCARCPVRDACLEYALATEQRFGIWGGMSERERRAERGRRAAAAARLARPDMLPRTAQRVAAVAELTAEGMTRAQIAARLGITERAVTYLRQRARDGAA